MHIRRVPQSRSVPWAAQQMLAPRASEQFGLMDGTIHGKHTPVLPSFQLLGIALGWILFHIKTIPTLEALLPLRWHRSTLR